MSLTTSQSSVIAREVRSMLERSQAFAALEPDERRQILDSTTDVAAQLVAREMSAPAHGSRRARDPYALGLADEDEPPGPGSAPPPTGVPPTAPMVPPKWSADERFQAEGTAAGVTQAGRMVNEVNFPAFVSSLVRGTFDAVVDASIQQMKAYGELVGSVAMSINDFRDQNTEVGEGRRHLQSKYPDIFDMTGDQLKVKQDFDSDAMPNFQADLGLAAPVEDLSEEGVIDALVTAARTELARGRQQLLATTILMGINRIIVTDGRINAKISFNFSAKDHVKRDGTVNDWDTSQKRVNDFKIGQYIRGRHEEPVPLLVSTTKSTSTADIKAEANMFGEVSLNFRSETFPLERMMTSNQLLQLNEAHGGARATPPAPPPPAATAPGAAPAPASTPTPRAP